KELLARASDMPDFPTLEASLKDTLEAVHDAFERIVRGGRFFAGMTTGDLGRRGVGLVVFVLGHDGLDGEGADHVSALAFAAGDAQGTAMELDQCARDGEPQAAALMALGELVLHLLEGPSQLDDIRLRDADAGILDGD